MKLAISTIAALVPIALASSLQQPFQASGIALKEQEGATQPLYNQFARHLSKRAPMTPRESDSKSSLYPIIKDPFGQPIQSDSIRSPISKNVIYPTLQNELGEAMIVSPRFPYPTNQNRGPGTSYPAVDSSKVDWNAPAYSKGFGGEYAMPSLDVQKKVHGAKSRYAAEDKPNKTRGTQVDRLGHKGHEY